MQLTALLWQEEPEEGEVDPEEDEDATSDEVAEVLDFAARSLRFGAGQSIQSLLRDDDDDGDVSGKGGGEYDAVEDEINVVDSQDISFSDISAAVAGADDDDNAEWDGGGGGERSSDVAASGASLDRSSKYHVADDGALYASSTSSRKKHDKNEEEEAAAVRAMAARANKVARLRAMCAGELGEDFSAVHGFLRSAGGAYFTPKLSLNSPVFSLRTNRTRVFASDKPLS